MLLLPISIGQVADSDGRALAQINREEGALSVLVSVNNVRGTLILSTMNAKHALLSFTSMEGGSARQGTNPNNYLAMLLRPN